MSASNTKSPLETDDLKRLESRLLEEWKIDQAKIDKIGEFRFNVKNWSMTITVAYLGGIVFTKAPWWCALFAFIPGWIFSKLEDKQEFLQEMLGLRVRNLENSLARLDEMSMTKEQSDFKKKMFGAAGLVPGLANTNITHRPTSKYESAKRHEHYFW